MAAPSKPTPGSLRIALALVALSLAVGCRSTTPSTHATAGRADAAPPAIAPAEAPTPMPASSPAAAPEPVVVATVAAVDSGLPPDAIVIPTPYDDHVTALFLDERLAVRDAVASALRARGLAVAPLDRLARLEHAAATGVLQPEADRACAVGLREADMVARWFRHAPTARVDLACDDGCSVRVTIERGGEISSFESPAVSRPNDVRAWVAAAKRLAPVEVDHGLSLIGSGTSAPGPIFFTPPAWVGPWRGEPAENPLDAFEAAAAGCDHPDPFASIDWTLRVAVASNGSITRCEGESDSPLARAQGAECLCAAIHDARFPAGRAGRRLRFSAIDFASSNLRPGMSIDAGHLEIAPGSDREALAPWLEHIQAHEIVDRCLLDHRPTDEISADVLLHLHADGRVQDVEIDGPFDTPPTMQLAACLADELRKVPLPCAPPGVSTLPLRFVFARNRPNPAK